MTADTKFPRWIDRKVATNLREVAPNLFVGAERSAATVPDRNGGRWAAVVDLYGVPFEEGEEDRYRHTDLLIHWPFLDGKRFPVGCLDAVAGVVGPNLGKKPVLLHCQAGLSRSASAAYAMMRALYDLPHAEAVRRVKVSKFDHLPEPVTIRSARAWVDGRLG